METEFERQNPGVDLVRSEVPYNNAPQPGAGLHPRRQCAGRDAAEPRLDRRSSGDRGTGALGRLPDRQGVEPHSQVAPRRGDHRRQDLRHGVAPGADPALLQPQSAAPGRTRSGPSTADLAGPQGSGVEDLRPAAGRGRQDLRGGPAHGSKPELGPVEHSRHLRARRRLLRERQSEDQHRGQPRRLQVDPGRGQGGLQPRGLRHRRDPHRLLRRPRPASSSKAPGAAV